MFHLSRLDQLAAITAVCETEADFGCIWLARWQTQWKLQVSCESKKRGRLSSAAARRLGGRQGVLGGLLC